MFLTIWRNPFFSCSFVRFQTSSSKPSAMSFTLTALPVNSPFSARVIIVGLFRSTCEEKQRKGKGNIECRQTGLGVKSTKSKE